MYGDNRFSFSFVVGVVSILAFGWLLERRRRLSERRGRLAALQDLHETVSCLCLKCFNNNAGKKETWKNEID